MVYCKNCGEQIDANVAVCPKCGFQQKSGGPSLFSGDNIIWAILGFLIPIAGLVLWFAWHESKPDDSKMALGGSLAAVILWVQFFPFFFFWFVF